VGNDVNRQASLKDSIEVLIGSIIRLKTKRIQEELIGLIIEIWINDTIKRLMSYPKCTSVKVINNSTRPRSNHKEVNYIKLQIINEKEFKRIFKMRY
jgi:hypothetical protein